ncbi:uncharacterized protein IAS62_001922 [Cryptococcus decagattii]|uniref:Uncharacterized protein n=1 Tax=Cryptococcus decagattii TaxID=1859122 RepID=A0ABZ2AQ26_9TREE
MAGKPSDVTMKIMFIVTMTTMSRIVITWPPYFPAEVWMKCSDGRFCGILGRMMNPGSTMIEQNWLRDCSSYVELPQGPRFGKEIPRESKELGPLLDGNSTAQKSDVPRLQIGSSDKLFGM